jgi:Sulfotransferase domain
MEAERHGATWLASYPKSGNTWLRCLLEAYRRNGLLDINDMRISSSDGGATIMQGVSPMPLDALGLQGELLLRPAALLNLFCRLNTPFFIKTHFANMQMGDAPHCIPKYLTEKAVYVVRDPRSVVSSFARFYKFPIETAADAMNSNEFVIGGNALFSRCLLSTWSNHVASWTSETNFPVHVVRYEDLVSDTAKELTEVLEFLGIEIDLELVNKSVAAANISNLKKAEVDKGFRENASTGGTFFTNGGTGWKDELGARWIKRIENDHGTVMKVLEYL